MLNFQLFPVQASTFAERVDLLYYALCIGSILITVGITIGIIVLSIMFRHKEGEERETVPLEAPILEMTWTIVPTIVFLAIFWWGAVLYADFQKVPEGAWKIDVVAKQWMWKIQHPNGVREVNTLHVPIGRPVELVMTSQDVLHDFFVPEFRVKQDVIPGRYSRLWFEATKLGEYHLFCAEYCGTEHSVMGGKVIVMTEHDYNEWLAGGPKVSPVESGAALFEQRGCVTCHSGRSGARGPDLAEVYGSTVRLTSGTEVFADEEYLRESIMESNKLIVEGFSPLMPSFANQLTPEDVSDLIAYIMSLSTIESADAVAE